MARKKENAVILSQEMIAKDIYSMWIKTDAAREAAPGQFISMYTNDGSRLLPRPISICEINKEEGSLRVVYRVTGKNTGTELFSRMKAGETIPVIGPLGNGFPYEKASGKKVFLMGGGIGVPPLLGAISHYGNNGTAITGFRSASAVILQDDFKAAGARAILCTDDGTAGERGFVTAALQKLLESETPDIVYACGPMLRAVAKMAEEKGIVCEISLEERMACGVGACLGCACRTVKNGVEGYSHVCKDGPVFNSREVRL